MTHAMRGGCNAAREIQRLDGILELLRNHISDGGSPTDEVTARLYVDYWGTGRRAIDIDAVKRWAERHTKWTQDARNTTTNPAGNPATSR